MRKIYDCFTFFNEFDLLEMRMQELYDHVDYFVIAESNVTHSGNPKPYHFLDNIDRYKPYADKIRHVAVTDMPGVTEEWGQNPTTGMYEIRKNFWHNERHQRNCLVRGLHDATDEDVLMVSDVDELIRGHCPDFIRYDYLHNLWGFRMPMFNYRFNYMWVKPLIFQVQGQAYTVARAKTFPNLSYIREVYGRVWIDRNKMYDDGTEMSFPHAGWHFSSLGDNEFVSNKLRNVADYFFEEADVFDANQYIEQNTSQVVKGSKFEPVILDEYFPKSLLDNKDRFAKLILADGEKSVMEMLSVIPLNSNLQY